MCICFMNMCVCVHLSNVGSVLLSQFEKLLNALEVKENLRSLSFISSIYLVSRRERIEKLSSGSNQEESKLPLAHQQILPVRGTL